jgi:tetratricopeptide (TPR) repeat protein
VKRFLLLPIILSVALAPTAAAWAAPQLPDGYPRGPAEPSTMSKFSTSVKSGFGKVTGALTPKWPVKQSADPISLSVPAKTSPEFYVAVARMAEEQDDLGKAEHHYRLALDMAPKSFEALMGYGHMLDRQSKLPEAAELYRLAIQSSPSDSSAHNDLGICCARLGKLTESLAALENAVRLQPKNARYRNNAATVHVQMNRPDQAFSHLKAVHPEAVAYYNLAFLVQQTGDTQTAARLFGEALARNPSMTEARLWMQRLQATQPQPSRQPAAVARRTPATAPTIPPQGAAAPIPPQGSTAPMPPQMQLPHSAAPMPPGYPCASRALAPMPSIEPLPPTRGLRQ